ncbi:putative RNA splicing factor [Heterostelium album PN500]|uniref:Pre-mRNA-splicing factor 18 n=1 Tax=Heterostelium pallidum (strain ATCC 26659 / Pp 5 / PN500) TaxID=670386 RepID=D3BQ00_HETP5|nr:putative RNA splicing factor [Heterostelium album PN500]EFA76551.1 putative RNA splicing factor [Heterostelium album PN500]|eukprot:XP_020428683.1 putative RNA splicing factor [Heterostelium album PN500]
MSNKLKEQLEKKRKEAQSLALSSGENGSQTKKYKTRGEIEKENLKKKEEEKLKLEKEKEEKLKVNNTDKNEENNNNVNQNNNNNNSDDNNNNVNNEPIPFLPKEQVVRKLRERGQPITYFGETDYMRAERLRLLEENEPIEYTQGDNEFQNLLKQINSEQKSGGVSGDADSQRKKSKEPEESEEELKEESKKSKYGNIYYFLWKLLKEWKEHLDARPEEEVRTPQGNKAKAIYAQCNIHIKPLFAQLKSKSLPDDLLQHIYKIVEFCKEREYSKANSQYMEMSIGNAPWPMGVTMVGIHDRSSREKISSSQVAHVLNDETQRKFIQGIKRLMTFCQTKYPNNPSKCVG